MDVKIIRVDKTLPLPEYHTTGAVAFDLYSRVDAELEPNEIKLLPSNFIIEVPEGHALIIAARSSTYKKGLRLTNSIGVIDQDYHGPNDEIHLAIYNYTDEKVLIPKGERIAQGLIIPVTKANWQEVDVIKETSRGGFGSTGA